MPSIGKHEAIRTGIIAEIRTMVFNDSDVYTCKINGKAYRMTEKEFLEKWKPYRVAKTDKQEVLL